ncbi:DNA/RNA non-specific endonuclease [Rhodoflexus caldus]|uniref:DNA/RNA non-specific endonuclease n=1 Tax=Rhodoflexus caldus TaxID=2891236 RepID=UPI00202AA9B5|nr:DNA/RNA non-specific endonuclease [Rhodoflexus caldus]
MQTKSVIAVIIVALFVILGKCKGVEVSSPEPNQTTTKPPATQPAPGGNTTDASQPTRDPHLALGNPSNATKDERNYDNFLIEHPQFVVSYNRSRGTANWVAWHLSKAWRGTARRQNNFRFDPSLPASWFRATTNHYTGSGFDRGHMCPSDDRDGSEEDNSATFLMTNIVPQAPKNNQETWRLLEEYCRRLADEGNEMYIYSGVYGRGGTGSNGTTTNIANGQITVPSRIWKVIVVLPVGTNDITRINANTRIIAVDTPNTQSVEEKPWGDYRVSVRAIEQATGLNFFASLPQSLQNTLETKVDNGPTR